MSMQLVKRFNVRVALYALFIAIITLRDSDCSVAPGLDTPFRWALNYFLAFHKEAFARIQYTVGPLCLLKWPAPVGDHILISSFYYLAIAWLFTYLYTFFYSAYRGTQQLIAPMLICCVLILVVNVDIIMIGCVLLCILYYNFLHTKWHTVLGVLITVTGVYIKTSLFALLCPVWAIFVIFLLVKKQYKYLAGLLIATALLFFLMGLLLTGSAAGVLHYAYNNMLFSLSYSDSLSLYPYNDKTYLGVCLCCILVVFALFRKQPAGYLMVIASVCLFACWKYSMGREDFFHALVFVYLLVLLFALFLAVQVKNIHAGSALFLIAICCYTTNLQYVFSYQNNYYWLPGFINFNERVLHAGDFKNKISQQSQQSCSVNKLPDNWRKTIGNNTVDIFPWDLSIIMINDLNYRYRPSLQSIGLNVANDVADASSLLSANAPEYIIWHTTPGDKTKIEGLDDQYLLNTCPATGEAILRGYSLTKMVNEQFAVWQKKPQASAVTIRNAGYVTTSWGDWIDIPPHDSNTIIKASISYSNTFGYTLRSLLYKGCPVFIEYQTDSGKVLHYHFSGQYGKEGLFINPLWIDNQLKIVNIKRVRFLNDRNSYFKNKLQVILQQETFSASSK